MRRITSAHLRVGINEESKNDGEESSKESFIRRNIEDDSGNIEEIWKSIGTLLLNSNILWNLAVLIIILEFKLIRVHDNSAFNMMI